MSDLEKNGSLAPQQMVESLAANIGGLVVVRTDSNENHRSYAIGVLEGSDLLITEHDPAADIPLSVDGGTVTLVREMHGVLRRQTIPAQIISGIFKARLGLTEPADGKDLSSARLETGWRRAAAISDAY